MTTRVAFEILYKEYYVRVFGLCRKLLNSAEQAEDATQESFMRAYRSFDRYDSEQPFWQWIASIANNYCIDLIRKRSKSGLVFGDEASELELLDSDALEGVELLIDDQQQEQLNIAVTELPDKYRIPLVLAYFNELSYDEIADELEVTRSHVGVLLLRAKQQLRKIVGNAQVEGADS